MDHEPRVERLVPESVKALLLLIAVIILVGVLIGFVVAAIGPSQDPNVGGHVPGGGVAHAAVR